MLVFLKIYSAQLHVKSYSYSQMANKHACIHSLGTCKRKFNEFPTLGKKKRKAKKIRFLCSNGLQTCESARNQNA